MAAVPEVVATSRDGRTFTFWSQGAPSLRAGDMVVVDASPTNTVLGQVLHVTADGMPGDGGRLTGSGVVLGSLAAMSGLDRGARAAFDAGAVRAADPDHLTALSGTSEASLAIGTWSTGDTGAPARLRAGGFNRHTFLCGQSGSGKTYALGVLLERLMLQTDLRIAVFDPNADFVHLGRALPGVPEPEARRIDARSVRVLRSDSTRTPGTEPLRLRFRSMTRTAQAAVLRLDPIRDHDEYNAFLGMLATLGQADLGTLLASLHAGTPAQQRLAKRVENLGLSEWEAWARDLPSAAGVVTGAQGVTVMDLGGFGDPMESSSIALEVVDELWAQRDRRVPTLVVIDEAHNLCRADPADPVATLLLERIIQIAAEGRKYGLWLLLSSQRPSKIHPQILSQCDNLMLMRMNSPDDVAELGRTFGFAPQSMLQASTGFVQGEALLAGGFAPVPMLVRMRERLTAQGGSDVSVPIATTLD
jgi:uncharacterized protein